MVGNAHSESDNVDLVPDWNRTCIFCGGRPLSKEHIFPKWLHPLLPKTGQLNHQTLFQMDTIDRTEAREVTNSGEPYAGRIRVVCAKCNNGWMSQLQEETLTILAALVQGEPAIMSRRQLRALAAWVAMFMMVTEWRTKNVQFVATTHEQRTALRASKKVPRSWRIWIATTSIGEEMEQFQRTTIPISNKNGADVRMTSHGRPVPNTHSTTVRMGRLLVHVRGSSHIDWVRRRMFANDQAMQQVWPVKKSPIIWPPARELELQEARDVAGALTHTARRIIFKRRVEHAGVRKS